VDKHKELRPENPSGIVLNELFGGLLATTEAFLRNGIKIRKLYVYENDPKAREAAKFRLEAFSLIFPELLAPDAWAECFTALPQDIRKISKEDLSHLEPADVIVAGFPCQGFSQASSLPLGLRDAR
jgi:site-specific DNA-cytosine methylase